MKVKTCNSNEPNWRTVTVKSHIPEALEKLEELSHNLWWIWNEEGFELFRSLDKSLFSEVKHNPSVLSYLLAGLSAMPILGLIGCILCGFSVGIMWPGSISITVPRIPKGGTALFALLAVAGDMGGAFGPSMVGYFSQQAGDNLQVGLLTGCTFPLIMLAALIAMRKMAKND